MCNKMYENVKSMDYTKKFLQSDSDPATMEVVTRTNAVKSPTNSPETTKLVYTVKEVAQMLAISQRAAYNLCNSTTEFRVLRAGGSIRIPSARQDGLKMSDFPAGFLRHQQHKNSQFYPNNNLT